MARYEVQGLMWVDTDLADAVVRVEDDSPGMPRFYVNLTTYRALANLSGANKRLGDALWDERGTFTLPRSVIEPEAAEDLRLGLSLVDPEPSEHCIYPPCGLAAEVVHTDGFPLCREHHALMSDWDDLLAV